jgi:hypothetical protein
MLEDPLKSLKRLARRSQRELKWIRVKAAVRRLPAHFRRWLGAPPPIRGVHVFLNTSNGQWTIQPVHEEVLGFLVSLNADRRTAPSDASRLHVVNTLLEAFYVCRYVRNVPGSDLTKGEHELFDENSLVAALRWRNIIIFHPWVRVVDDPYCFYEPLAVLPLTVNITDPPATIFEALQQSMRLAAEAGGVSRPELQL